MHMEAYRPPVLARTHLHAATDNGRKAPVLVLMDGTILPALLFLKAVEAAGNPHSRPGTALHPAGDPKKN
jgi:hypothetical protein